MSLLKKPKFNTRLKKSLLIGVALLLLVPCVAAAAFAVRFDTQDPAVQEQERKEKEKDKEVLEMKVRSAQAFQKSKERSAGNEEQIMSEIARKQEIEHEARAIMHAALVQLAKINMDQAIQVASSQYPGKVLICSLGATGWEEPGKLAKDGKVFYHVIIADETNPGVSTHVWVNAIDGTVMKTEKELPRKQRNPFEN